MSNKKIFLVAGNNWGVGKGAYIDFCLTKIKGESLNLGDGVKQEVSRIYGLDYSRLMTDKLYKYQHRSKLQEIGEGYRQQDPYAWCRLVQERIQSLSEVQSFFIGDIRHIGEIEYFSIQPGYEIVPVFIYVTPSVMRKRLNDENYARWLQDFQCSSQRQMNLDIWDWKYIIGNNGSLEYLKQMSLLTLQEEGI